MLKGLTLTATALGFWAGQLALNWGGGRRPDFRALALGLLARRIAAALAPGRAHDGASGPAGSLALYIVVSVGLTLTLLVLKGTFGARYHMMYLPAALLAAGLALERLWAARHGHWGGPITLTGIYVGAMLSWSDWTAGEWWPGRRAVVLAGAALAVGFSLTRGPLVWGQFAPYEPEPRSPVLQQVEGMYHGDGA